MPIPRSPAEDELCKGAAPRPEQSASRQGQELPPTIARELSSVENAAHLAGASFRTLFAARSNDLQAAGHDLSKVTSFRHAHDPQPTSRVRHSMFLSRR